MSISTNHAQESITPESGVLTIDATGALALPSGAQTARPLGAVGGHIRFDQIVTKPEYFDGSNWQTITDEVYVDNKIADFMGLNPFLGETMQAQKYAPEQYYKEHYDYFCPLSREFKTYTEWMGQRTWTFMLYLNDVEEGGETLFKHLKLKIKPTAGKAVVWNNLYSSGIPNPKTMHEALPPISGDKYVVTKWWRSWPLI
jgi:hypothetical protein